MTPPETLDDNTRWKQRFASFRRAAGLLTEAVARSNAIGLTDLEREGMIQRFEFTHELAWNTLKDFLSLRTDTKTFGSRDTTRTAFANELIADGEGWMEMIKSRNRTSHVYDEEEAADIAKVIVERYEALFKTLVAKLETFL